MVIQACPPAYEPSNTEAKQSQFTAHHQETQILRSVSHSDQGRHISECSVLSQEKVSLDFTQRLERKLAEYNASTNIFKRWLFEILCWIASAICMGAIVGIYAWLQNRPLTEVGNLLTYANTLGKVASAALIVPTSEALGQLKWNWFQKSNAMWDFEIFDKASRGPLGAALLLFRTKGRSLAALGALLIVLLLAIDTFFQQVVEFPDRWALQHATSAIPRIVQYQSTNLPEYWQKWETTQYDKNLRPVVQEFLYNNGTQPTMFGNGTRPDIPLSCPTSNCTWPPYETLAVCSSCKDVSESINLEFACLNTTIDWTLLWLGPLRDVPYPNGTVCGYFLNATSTTPILLSGIAIPDNTTNRTTEEALLARTLPLTKFQTKDRLYNTGSIEFQSIRNPILDFLISSARNGSGSVYRREPPVVHECLLSWCVQTMKSSYEYGTYHEEIYATYRNVTAGPSPWISFNIPEEEGGGIWTQYMENVTIAAPVSHLDDSRLNIPNANYGVNNVTASMVLSQFDDMFPSYYTRISNSTEPQLRYREFEDGPYSRPLSFNPWLAPNNLTRHMERFATAMTNVIRSSPSRDDLYGNAYQTENYVQIRWEWLSFPFALLALSLAFLISTMIKTSGDGAVGLWKTSAMPTLIYSLPKETRGQFTSPSTWGSGKGAPRKTRIKLLPNMGWRISGQSYLSRSPRLPSGERVPRGWI